MAKKLRIGIIGCGSIAHAHARAYQKFDDVEVVAGADIIPGKAKAFFEKYGVEGAAARTFVTTDKCRGTLKEFSDKMGYETFVVPEPYIAKSGMKIMSLAEPTSKMSKSDTNQNAVVYILDGKDDIIRKFKRAVTDSEAVVRFDEQKPGVSNLMSIYSCFTGKQMDEIEREFEGKGYGDFKNAVGEAVVEENVIEA